MSRQPPFWLIYAGIVIACIWLLPATVLAVCLLNEGFGLRETMQHLLAQLLAERRNLLLVGLPALVPLALLALVLAAYRRWRGIAGCHTVTASGLLVIIVLLIWANANFWRLYLPGREYPGWPHGLEMVIVPIFFAPVGLLLAVAIAIALQYKLRKQ